MTEFKDIFVSYGRRESLGFVGRLHQRLKLAGYDVWFDKVNIPDGDDYALRINYGIESAHNFVYVMAPRCMTSAYCLIELEYARLLGKRVIPLNQMVIFETANRPLSAADQAVMAGFYQAHNLPDQGIKTTQDVLNRSHALIGRTDWLDAKCTMTPDDENRQMEWARQYENFWNRHEDPGYLQTFEFPVFGQTVDDLDGVVERLRTVVDRDDECVRKHTLYLTKALYWQKNQRLTRFLLDDAETTEALAWLTRRYGSAELPPCTPSVDHVHYITESKKKMQGGMTDVFICYAREDVEVRDKVRLSLAYHGLTTWFDTQDISKGTDYATAINRGIERADNLLFFISPKSVKSEYCLKEIEHAAKYNKRIIPLLIEATDATDFPKEVRMLQWIDFTDNVKETDYQADIDDILREFNKEREYHNFHKLLLVNAIKWDERQRPASGLLTGNELTAALEWAEKAGRNALLTPLAALSQTFLRESKKQIYKDQISGLDVVKDAFISYNRGHSLEFVWDLYMRLTDEKFEVWFDQNDIPLGVDFQSQIDQGIIKGDNFIFVISPGSVSSIYCLKEVLLALQYGKRIIPILHVMPANDDWARMAENVHRLKADFPLYDHPLSDTAVDTLQKLNWVMCREHEDDVEKSLHGLFGLMRLHSDHIKQHTQLLVKALDWHRHQRTTDHLLVGEDRIKAEAWLKQEFEKAQPPCLPSDLHAEFICESKKNGQNLMTNVFICYAREDVAIRDMVRLALARHGLTSWIHDQDIHKGVDWAEAINSGIEKADNILFFISPEAVVSEYCLKELNYATQFNKRIIPLLIKPTDSSQIPDCIRSLQYIDFTDNVKQADFEKDVNDILAEFHKDGDYYFHHKAILVQALKWERNNRNKSFLLRGFNLKQAEAWLKVGQKMKQNQPIELHEHFIKASQGAGASLTTEVFISYSRANADFARKLNEQLQLHGKTTWFDQESIASGSDFAAEINNGIENADNFLFILSPISIQSEYCADEVEHARQFGKRFVTLLYEDINTDELHPELAKVQWIDFRPQHTRFTSAFGELVRTLDTDLAHVRMHTRMQMRQTEWAQKSRDNSLLLVGSELAKAEKWISESATKDPAPTTGHREYILASRKEATRKRNQRIAIFAALTIISIFALVATWSYFQSEKNRQIAVQQRAIADEQRQRAELSEQEALRQKEIAESNEAEAQRQKFIAEERRVEAEEQRQLAEQLKELAEKHKNQAINNEVQLRLASVDRLNLRHDGLNALLESVQAGYQIQHAEVPDYQYLDTVAALKNTIRNSQEFNRLTGHESAVKDVQISPVDGAIASVTKDGVIRLFDSNGHLQQTLDSQQGLITSIKFSPDGKKLVSVGLNGAIKMWDPVSGQSQTMNAHDEIIWDVVFSQDGQKIATAAADNTIKMWDRKGTLLQRFEGHHMGVTRLSFHPTEPLLASASWDGTIRVWDVVSGQGYTLIEEPDDIFIDAAFSPDGKSIATANTNKIVEIWNLSGTTPLKASISKKLAGHDDQITSIDWSPDSRYLLSASADLSIRVWQTDGSVLTELLGHEQKVNRAAFSADGGLIVSGSDDQSVRFWRYVKDTPVETDDLDKLIQNGCAWLADYLNTGAVELAPGVCDGIVSKR